MPNPVNDGWDRCTRCMVANVDALNANGKRTKAIEMIECNACDSWFHIQCANIGREEVAKIDKFHCVMCVPSHGPSTYLRKSTRCHSSVDYVSLHAGEAVAANGHAYTSMIRSRRFTADDFPRMRGSDVTSEWARKCGLHRPVVVPAGHDTEGLGMKLPTDLNVKQVAELVGLTEKVEVIDVPTQGGVPGWTLGQWADYYDAENDRDRVRNVISLEVSSSKLGELCTRPQLVRDLDLVDRVWPPGNRDHQGFPKVQLYCLMSVANSYTDFHIDFGGSSVFYHILQGSKSFLFIPPNSTNLKKYEHWCQSPDQNKTFLGDDVKECYKVELQKGDTMFIPSGWIHAVYTPDDSLVIGGNFLTPIHLARQIAISRIEQRTLVPRKFRFPSFSRVLWLTALDYLRTRPSILSDVEKQGLEPLSEYLALQVDVLQRKNDSREYRRTRDSVPSGYDAKALALEFRAWIEDVLDLKPQRKILDEHVPLPDLKVEAVKTEEPPSAPAGSGFTKAKRPPHLKARSAPKKGMKASLNKAKRKQAPKAPRPTEKQKQMDESLQKYFRSVGLGLRAR